MSRFLIGSPVYSDANGLYVPTAGGGLWESDLPVSNLLLRDSDLIARSQSAALADTQFDVDLKRTCQIGAIGLYHHTISLLGKIRTRLLGAVPAFDSLTVGDASWTNVGTPTRSAAAFTSADGIPLDLIGDNDGAATEFTQKAITFTGNGTKAVRFRVARSSAYAGHDVDIKDVTAGAFRLTARCDFTTPTLSVTCAPGTFVSATARGDGSWDVLCLATGVVAANSNVVLVNPAGIAAADTAAFYVGAISAWDAATDQQSYDSGLVEAWPVVYSAASNLPVGDPRLVTGKYSADERLLRDIGHTLCPSVSSLFPLGRYLRVEIQDTTNPAGYLDVGRLMVCGVVQPPYNMSVGASFGLSSSSTRDEMEGGAVVYTRKRARRSHTFEVENLTRAEAHASWYEFLRTVDTTEQFIFVEDPADLTNRTSYPAVLRELSPLKMPYSMYSATGYSIVEDL